MKQIGLLFLGMLVSLVALADNNAAKTLSQILSQYKSLTANFVQTSSDEQGNGDKLEQKSTGRMAVLRPDFFRWDTLVPLKQYIISDGRNIWIYDVDLEQVTIEPAHQMLDQAPAALLTNNTQQLLHDFTVTQQSSPQAGQWFTLESKNPQDLYHKIKINFIQNKLNQMEVENGAGQITKVQFTDVRINPTMGKDSFKVKIPKNVDVIGKAE